MNYAECGVQLILLSVACNELCWVWRAINFVECGVQLIMLSVAYN